MKTKLKLIRKERNLTQTELGEKIGKTKGVVGNWERETTELMLEDACAICDALHCTLDELAGREVPHSRVTQREKSLIEDFRELNIESKTIIENTARALNPSRMEREKTKSVVQSAQEFRGYKAG